MIAGFLRQWWNGDAKNSVERAGHITPTILPLSDDFVGQDTDAIVNAADWTLCGGTGIDGAIHEEAGHELGEYIHSKKARLQEAGVFMTPGFKLRARHIIHTCAPVYDCRTEDDTKSILAACYTNCLAAADEAHIESISFPLLGGGAFGWGAHEAIDAMMKGISAYGKTEHLKEIRLVFRTEQTLRLFEKITGMKGEVRKSHTPYHSGKNGMEFLDGK